MFLVQPWEPLPFFDGADRSKKGNPPSEKFWKFTTRVVSETKDEMKVQDRSWESLRGARPIHLEVVSLSQTQYGREEAIGQARVAHLFTAFFCSVA